MSDVMGAGITWFLIGSDDREFALLPRWTRTVGLADDGTIYMSAILGGSEKVMLLCAGYDGTRCCEWKGHLYVPADWMAREFPKTSEGVRNVTAAIRAEARGMPPDAG
jgi:hypothetical protein